MNSQSNSSTVWGQWLREALDDFNGGLVDSAVEKIRVFRTVIDGASTNERMHALGTAATLLEESGLITLAITTYEELITVALDHEPRSIRTARDWARLGRLYGRTGQNKKETKALEHALDIYEHLCAEDRELLQPDEIGRVHLRVTQSRLAHSSQQVLNRNLQTKKSLLYRMAEILRNELEVLGDHPEVIVQQLHNGLSPFRGSRLVEATLTGFKDYLVHQRRNWWELVRILGPGKDGWLQRQSVVRTHLPERIHCFAVVSEGCFLVFTDSGTAWKVALGGAVQFLTIAHMPRQGELAMASLGSTMAFVDKESNLRFYHFENGSLHALDQTYPKACQITRSETHFVASFGDGRVTKFNANGQPETSIYDTQSTSADLIFAWADGSRVILVTNFHCMPRMGSMLQFASFDPSGIEFTKELPVEVRSIQHSWYSNTLLIGALDGFRFWNPEFEFPLEAHQGTADSIIRSKNGRYTAMIHSGIRVIGHGLSLQASPPLPAGELAVQQLEFQDCGSETLLHVAVGNVIETWSMGRLAWYPSITAGWVERAKFARDGSELVAMSPVGITYLWQVEDGKLVEMEKWDPDAHMIIWAPNGNIGAVCRPDRVELVNQEQKFLWFFNDHNSHSVAWNRAGTRLAWAALSSSEVRLAEYTPGGFSLYSIPGEENYFPLSPVLSPEGDSLAYIRGHFRTASLPELGVSAKMGITGRFIAREMKVAINEGIVLVDLRTRASRILLVNHPEFFKTLWYASGDRLLASDEAGCVLMINPRTKDVSSRCWISEGVVAAFGINETLRLCDTGMTAAFGPVVYDFKVYHQGEVLVWD